jgi:hypothetical protein
MEMVLPEMRAGIGVLRYCIVSHPAKMDPTAAQVEEEEEDGGHPL